MVCRLGRPRIVTNSRLTTAVFVHSSYSWTAGTILRAVTHAGRGITVGEKATFIVHGQSSIVLFRAREVIMAQHIVAVDLGGTQIRAALCAADGQIFRRVAKLTEAKEGPDAVIGRIFDAISEAIGDVPLTEIAGIGLGAPGPLNPATGIVLEAPNLPGWNNVPLRTLISQHFSRPTFLGNDANVAGLAEHLYGAARGIRDMIYLTISTGIGSGIIVDGRMLLGAEGLAAEAGHIIIVPNGPLCGCGAHGCLESLAAGPAIARDVVTRIKAGKKSRIVKLVDGNLDNVDARIVSTAAQLGDKLAISAFRRAGEYLGIGIANLLRLFNPRMIVLGGSVTKAGPFLFDPMRAAIKANVLPMYREGLAITQAALGDDVGLLGAAALAVTELEKRQGERQPPPSEKQPPDE